MSKAVRHGGAICGVLALASLSLLSGPANADETDAAEVALSIPLQENVLVVEAAESSERDIAPQLKTLTDARAKLASGQIGGEHPVYKLRPEPYSDSGKRAVTLQELLDLALGGGNFGLQRQGLTNESSHYDVDKTYYAFDPQWGASLSYNKRTSGAAGAAGAGGVSSSQSYSGSATYTKPLQDGSSYNFSYDLSRSEISTTQASIPTTWSGGFSLGYNRPLLRGAGKRLNLIPRYTASNNLLLGYDKLTDDTRNLKAQILNTWFRAVAAREAIKVRESNLELALKQLERQVERYKVGLAIQSELLQAENNVLSQRSSLLSARNDLQTLLDQLTSLTGEGQEYELTVDADSALIDLGGTLPDGLWDSILTNNYDLKALQTQRANLLLGREATENRLKPQLDLGVTYGRNGEDTGLVGSLGNYENESYGVRLNYSKTQGERATKADLAQTDLNLASLDLTIQETELRLKNDLRQAQRDLLTSWQQVELAENNVKVVRETYNIMVERNAVGLATALDVIEAQQNVLAAELALLNAKVAYQESYRSLQLQAGLL
jgi:outer membrane protein